MNRIWKFVIDVDSATVELSMPKDATILTAQEQHGVIALWAIVNPEAPKEKRTFKVQLTGDAVELPVVRLRAMLPGMPKALWHVATIQFDHGEYVCHLFEVLSAG